MKKKKKLKHPDLLKGNIAKTLWILAWPTIIATIMQTTYNIIDTLFVGMIPGQGTESVAAVRLVFPVVMIMIALATGIGIGATALVSRYLGAKRYKSADQAAKQAVVFGTFVSLFIMVIGFALSRQIFSLTNPTVAVLDLAVQYSMFVFAGTIFMFLFHIIGSILRGEGDMKSPMKFILISTIFNVIFDAIFILPQGLNLGVTGAGLATLLARFIAFAMIFHYVYYKKSRIRIEFSNFKINWKIVKKLLKIGTPAALNQILMAGGIFILLNSVAVAASTGLKAQAQAAYGIGYLMDSIAMMPMVGIIYAVIAMIGHNLGANQIDRARRITWTSSVISAVAMGVIGLILFISSFWVNLVWQGAFAEYLAMYMRIVCLSYIFMGFGIGIGASMLGEGRAMPGLVINLLRIVVLVVPLAYVFGKLWGVNGVWIAIAASTTLSGIVSLIWYAIWPIGKVRKSDLETAKALEKMT